MKAILSAVTPFMKLGDTDQIKELLNTVQISFGVDLRHDGWIDLCETDQGTISRATLFCSDIESLPQLERLIEYLRHQDIIHDIVHEIQEY